MVARRSLPSNLLASAASHVKLMERRWSRGERRTSHAKSNSAARPIAGEEVDGGAAVRMVRRRPQLGPATTEQRDWDLHSDGFASGSGLDMAWA